MADTFWELAVCPFRSAVTATADGRPITGFDVSSLTGGLGDMVRCSDLHAALLGPPVPTRLEDVHVVEDTRGFAHAVDIL